MLHNIVAMLFLKTMISTFLHTVLKTNVQPHRSDRNIYLFFLLFGLGPSFLAQELLRPLDPRVTLYSSEMSGG